MKMTNTETILVEAFRGRCERLLHEILDGFSEAPHKKSFWRKAVAVIRIRFERSLLTNGEIAKKVNYHMEDLAVVEGYVVSDPELDL